MKKPILIIVVVLVLIFIAFYFFTKNSEKGSYNVVDDSGLEVNSNSNTMKITSSAFENNGDIPSEYTCDFGKMATNPPLEFLGVPENAKSLVLLMDDPDIPESVKQARGIEKFDHWTLYGMLPNTLEIKEGEVVGAVGLNSAGSAQYAPPCPPDGKHRYFFKLFALDTNINFIKAPTQADVEAAMQGHILDQAELVGLYQRK